MWHGRHTGVAYVCVGLLHVQQRLCQPSGMCNNVFVSLLAVVDKRVCSSTAIERLQHYRTPAACCCCTWLLKAQGLPVQGAVTPYNTELLTAAQHHESAEVAM